MSVIVFGKGGSCYYYYKFIFYGYNKDGVCYKKFGGYGNYYSY